MEHKPVVPETLLPWQEDNWSRISQLRQADRLPHAMLLYGLPGIGIRRFAELLAHAVLCGEGAGAACGTCHGCQLAAAGTHPDLMLLEPEKAYGAIKVDQVRELVDFGHVTAHLGGYRVVIVCPAEAMNVNAANSLLKTLEEPGADTLLLLLSYSPAAVLPTIRSRCQLMAMDAPSSVQGREWLAQQLEDPAVLDSLHQFAPQQPLSGLRLEPQVKELELVGHSLPAVIEGRTSPLQAAQAWAGLELNQVLEWLYQWLSGACLSGQQGAARGTVAQQIHASWVARAPLQRLISVVDELPALRRQLAAGSNPNKELLLENLALRMAPQGQGV